MLLKLLYLRIYANLSFKIGFNIMLKSIAPCGISGPGPIQHHLQQVYNSVLILGLTLLLDFSSVDMMFLAHYDIMTWKLFLHYCQ